MSPKIQFGTDGWRGIIAQDFTFDNVRLCAQGVANYLKKEGGAARRWKTQVNENSKGWAFFDLLPELHHNSVVGFNLPPAEAKSLFVILLTSPLLSPRLKLRFKLTAQLLKQARVSFQEVGGEGEGPLSQMMSLVLWGDWVSYYLALLHGVDPSPNPAVDYLKQQLRQVQQ